MKHSSAALQCIPIQESPKSVRQAIGNSRSRSASGPSQPRQRAPLKPGVDPVWRIWPIALWRLCGSVAAGHSL